ncbi:M20/M25/M40 family metallo-hydrolase [Amycolatopsis pigmentata]|uniref:M20/M25/M40 family metallo-hydrolase n=1 Tax=Amycolatopsis pigmentata TaxID=450801 RepID=A0ABW5FP53_9PSEU
MVGPSPGRVRGHRRFALAAVVCLLFSACGSETGKPPEPVPRITDGQLAQQLKSAVSDSGAFTHLQALQEIADRNGGNRASPGPGYDASVDYVVSVLHGAGYDVTTPTYALSPDDSHGQPPPRNVIAQTRTGDSGRVVLLGAHLDSVPQGPGIVDNGSGVATLLEIATHLSASAPVRDAVRFAFFGSEETGSQGSGAYVQSLSAQDRAKLMLYLNLDMVASPNAGYFAQGGRGNDKSEAGPPGSATVAGVLADQLAKTGMDAENAEFTGDDEAPFIDANIPSGGAENGDRKDKNPGQAHAWGGQAGQPFDPCYHKACDQLGNVNRDVLNRYLHAVAGTTAYFATSGQDLPG